MTVVTTARMTMMVNKTGVMNPSCSPMVSRTSAAV